MLLIRWKKCRIHHGFGLCYLYQSVAVYLRHNQASHICYFPWGLPRQTIITHSGSTYTFVITARTTLGIHYAGLSAPDYDSLTAYPAVPLMILTRHGDAFTTDIILALCMDLPPAWLLHWRGSGIDAESTLKPSPSASTPEVGLSPLREYHDV